jgi:uncharacterized protein (UPF0261 family)
MSQNILLISTLDTKGEEAFYLRDRIQTYGLNPVLMDLAMRGVNGSPAQITPEQVAQAGGSSLEQMQASRERSFKTRITIDGACRIARQWFDDGLVQGVLGLGGSTGSLMATEVMRSLPFGLPKLMVSSTAALPGLATRYIGTGDIALFHSVVEISGLTSILKNVLERAAAAMAGMLGKEISVPKSENGKAIALTMLGPCELCASAVRQALSEKGFEVIGFSAAGIGDKAMEAMIAGGLFHGVIDLAPGGVGEHHFGFMRDAGPHRLENAGSKGLPQIVSTCSVNHMTPSKSHYKPEYKARPKYDLDKFRSWLRLSNQELLQVADLFIDKLNQAKGPVKVIIPLQGWSGVDCRGNPTYNPDEDRDFVLRLKAGLRQDITVIEVDANMEDPEFATAVIRESATLFNF